MIMEIFMFDPFSLLKNSIITNTKCGFNKLQLLKDILLKMLKLAIRVPLKVSFIELNNGNVVIDIDKAS